MHKPMNTSQVERRSNLTGRGAACRSRHCREWPTAACVAAAAAVALGPGVKATLGLPERTAGSAGE
eukprot:13592237-Alexandrium_andersonii.AAC.1